MEGNLAEFVINEGLTNINHTAGMFSTEQEADDEFNRLAELTGCFKVYRQKTGHIHYLPRWRDFKENYRPDFVLIPRRRLIEAGWPVGQSIVVDAKKSSIPIGPGCNQLWDYLCASYECGRRIVRPTWAFLWPARKQEKCTASLMSHQHFGTVIHGDIEHSGATPGELHFYCGEDLLLAIGQTIRVGNLEVGRRSGSR